MKNHADKSNWCTFDLLWEFCTFPFIWVKYTKPSLSHVDAFIWFKLSRALGKIIPLQRKYGWRCPSDGKKAIFRSGDTENSNFSIKIIREKVNRIEQIKVKLVP